MADKAATPETPGDRASPGKELDPPDQATAAGPAKSGDGAGQRDTASSRDTATSPDEVQPKFREALERKRAREAGTIGTPGGKGTGKVHDAHGPARNRRSFRRKSG